MSSLACKRCSPPYPTILSIWSVRILHNNYSVLAIARTEVLCEWFNVDQRHIFIIICYCHWQTMWPILLFVTVKPNHYIFSFVRPQHSKPGMESCYWSSTDQLAWCDRAVDYEGCVLSQLKPSEFYILSCGKKPRSSASAFSTAENVELLGHYTILSKRALATSDYDILRKAFSAAPSRPYFVMSCNNLESPWWRAIN